MIYLLPDIVRDVRVCMDENAVSDALVASGDIDTLTLDEIIESKVVDGVRDVHMYAPNYMLDLTHDFTNDGADAVYWFNADDYNDGAGYVQLPDRFMRLIVFEMSDWEMAAFNAISTTDAEYSKQRSRFKGVRGNAQKPVVAIAINQNGRILEFYSSKNQGATIKRAKYMPYPKIDDDGGIEICEPCYRAVIYNITSLVCQTLGRMDQANAMTGIVKGILNLE